MTVMMTPYKINIEKLEKFDWFIVSSAKVGQTRDEICQKKKWHGVEVDGEKKIRWKYIGLDRFVWSRRIPRPTAVV